VSYNELGGDMMYDIYVVKEGDTLESLAKEFQLPVFDLIRMNGIENIYQLTPGLELKVPKKEHEAFTFYHVRPGDTIYSIARENHTSPEYIIVLNGLNPHEYIYPNQELLIPREDIAIYLTKQGDSLQQIARKTNQRPEDLLLYNHKIALLKDQLIAYKRNEENRF